MRAVAKTAAGPGNLELIDAPRPRASAGEIVIQVLAAGICGSDMTVYHWSEQVAAQLGVVFPCILGHEFAGRVVEVGAGVSEPSLGALVTVNPHLFCKKCYYCQTDRPEICDNRPIVGYSRPGGFAEYVAVRAENAYRLPASVPAPVAALGEPLALGLHLAARAGIGPGSVPVVLGPGPIGIVTALGCQAAGAERVLVAGLPEDEDRLAVARRLGLETYHAQDVGFVEAVREATLGMGAETVFEASGSAGALKQALDLCRKDGTVVAVGIPGRDVPVDVAALVLNEKRIVGSRGYRPQDWQAVAQLIARRADDLSALVSEVLPLARFAEGFAAMEARRGLRVILDPTVV